MDTRVKSTYMCAYTINYECTDWDAQWMASYHSYVETHLYLAASLIRAFADDGGAVVLPSKGKKHCVLETSLIPRHPRTMLEKCAYVI